jgi:hypothetical protein
MIYNLKKGVYLFSIFCRKFLYTFYSFVKILILTKLKYKIPKINGDAIVIIGNAPSFSEDYTNNPDFFTKKDLLCVNNFPSTERYELLKPKYVFLLDGVYFGSEETLQPWAKKTLDNIRDKTNWKITLFVPQLSAKAQYIKQIASRNNNVTLCYYNYTIVDGFDTLTHFLYKNNLGMPVCKNVILGAIFSAINMRYKTIYLTGVDNSFFKDIVVDKQNDMYLNMAYFSAKDADKRTGHFYNNLEKGEKMDVSDFFRWCYFNFLGYKKLEAYAKSMDVKVINTTENSYIDAFERKTISELL